MKDYLNQKINFENIDLNRLEVLIQSVAESKEPTISRVKNRFEEIYNNFDVVLTFLIQTRLVSIAGGRLVVNMSVGGLNKEKFAEVVTDNIFKNESSINYELTEFFNHFVFKNNRYWFSPGRKLRLQTSGIRNFFITLGFLEYNSDADAYIISEKNGKYFTAIIEKRKLTPTQLLRNLSDNAELGMVAERAVLEYERSRLHRFPELINKISHISQEKVNAGYDIQSFSCSSSLKDSTPRYIEVKAVSPIDYKFYWSRNEIEVAKMLGDQYFLYLVPIKQKGIPDTFDLKLIQNPYNRIILNQNDWKREIELTSFSKSS